MTKNSTVETQVLFKLGNLFTLFGLKIIHLVLDELILVLVIILAVVILCASRCEVQVLIITVFNFSLSYLT